MQSIIIPLEQAVSSCKCSLSAWLGSNRELFVSKKADEESASLDAFVCESVRGIEQICDELEAIRCQLQSLEFSNNLSGLPNYQAFRRDFEMRYDAYIGKQPSDLEAFDEKSERKSESDEDMDTIVATKNAVFLLDVNKLTAMNRDFGSALMDELISEWAQCLRSFVADCGSEGVISVYHIGGGRFLLTEYMIAVPPLTAHSEVRAPLEEFCKRVIAHFKLHFGAVNDSAIQRPMHWTRARPTLPLSMSASVVIWDDSLLFANRFAHFEWFQRVECALLRAKSSLSKINVDSSGLVHGVKGVKALLKAEKRVEAIVDGAGVSILNWMKDRSPAIGWVDRVWRKVVSDSANVDIQDTANGYTALMYAIECLHRGDSRAFASAMLVATSGRGIDPNRRNAKGQTTLMMSLQLLANGPFVPLTYALLFHHIYARSDCDWQLQCLVQAETKKVTASTSASTLPLLTEMSPRESATDTSLSKSARSSLKHPSAFDFKSALEESSGKRVSERDSLLIDSMCVGSSMSLSGSVSGFKRKSYLDYALDSGDFVAILALSECGVDSIKYENSVRFFDVCRSGNVDAVRYFIEVLKYNANYTNASQRLRTALHECASLGHYKLCAYLLDTGANVDALDQIKSTPLHLACFASQMDAIQVLVTNGANVNVRNARGWTPLLSACNSFVDNDTADIVKYMCKHDADLSVAAVECSGGLAFDIAANNSCMRSRREVCAYLKALCESRGLPHSNQPKVEGSAAQRPTDSSSQYSFGSLIKKLRS